MKFRKDDRSKYRAWDEGVDRMFYIPNGITLDELSALAKEAALENDDPDYQDQWFIDNPKCKWMESTGATSDGGALIFEGDIIENKYCALFEIRWDPWKCGFVAYVAGYSIELSELEQKSGPIKVVGNIYENPELLK